MVAPPPERGGLVAKLVGEIVAHATWSIERDTLHIEHLYVAAELRRKRIGRGLLSEIAKLAAAMQCRFMAVGADCPLGDYFLRRGFECRDGLIVKRLSEGG